MGGVAGLAWRPLKGRLTVFPEISAYAYKDAGPSFVPHLSVGLQWDLGGKAAHPPPSEP